jgi:hypothetical protein
MHCPAEIAAIVLEILQWGLLDIRNHGWGGDAARCAVEADHLHNLPALLTDFQPEALKYYWEVERPLFIEKSSAEEVTHFEELWDELSHHVSRVTNQIAG